VSRAPAVREQAGSLDASTSAPPAERRILAVLGEVKRVRRWAVPKLLRVRAFLGEVRIELRENAIPDDFMLDVRAWGGRVTLVVPPGVDVGFDVLALGGNAITQASEPSDESKAKRIRVSGTVVLGEVRALVRDRDG
jgi:predicted membrane protein